MSAVGLKLAAASLAVGIAFSSAGAVGLGPLSATGLTRTDRKGFYLTLINPYPSRERFRVYSVELNGEGPVARVLIPISTPLLGPKSQRRVLVVATGLAPGEEHKFRVCAERVAPAGEELIHARVCSKLTARRLA
jgi:P pilus assembly chaperone PapD